MGKVALVIIYNHKYEKNISILDNIYAKRFDHIYHLVPFYNGELDHVIPVYGNSYYFQGYIAQAAKILLEKNFDHYLFIADDLILNPQVNQTNYHKIFKLNEESSFIPDFISLHNVEEWWARVSEAYKWQPTAKGIEIKDELPIYKDVIRKLQQFNLDIKPLKFNQIWKSPRSLKDLARMAIYDPTYPLRFFMDVIFQKKYNLGYPLVGSYSDICIVSVSNFKMFSHYCGIFFASELFVELAIPSSLILSAKEIITESDLGIKGRALWTKQDFKVLDAYDYSLNKLLYHFPTNNLYLHPVKLSKWEYKYES